MGGVRTRALCSRADSAAKKLHIFDMDGTLLLGNASLELSRHVGQVEAVLEIEGRWTRGEVGHVEFYELLLPLWAGRLAAKDVETVFDAAKWIDGTADVFADIAKRGEHVAVITGSPLFFAELLMRWGACSAHGAAIEIGSPVDPSSVVTPESKVTIAQELMRHHGVGPNDCVAYGDSSSDVPLFRWMPHTVAVNGTDELKGLAAAVYDGEDLRAAYAAGRKLLGDESAAS